MREKLETVDTLRERERERELYSNQTKLLKEIKNKKEIYKDNLKNENKNIILDGQKGITLFVLVITIVILIILATIGINAAFGDNGLTKQAGTAKERTEISTEKELVDTAALAALNANEWEEITYEGLDEQLKINIGEGKYVLEGDGPFSVIYVNTKRIYEVDEYGRVTEGGKIIEDKTPGDITKDEEGNELDGSEENPYEIWCIEDLCAFSNMFNTVNYNLQGKYTKLMKDLDFNSNFSYVNGNITVDGSIKSCNSIEELKRLLTTNEGFNPIGTVEMRYTGTFNGNNKTIKNTYINRTGSVGIFGYVRNATIHDLIISGNITGTENAGGICGFTQSDVIINGCCNQANVTGTITAGGICGVTTNGNLEILNCYNGEQAKISCSEKDGKAGGILGSSGAVGAGNMIYNCYNLGSINGIASGGIIGSVYHNTKCINVYSTGNISGTNVGGIIGSALWDNVSENVFENCFFKKSDTVQKGGGIRITVDATPLDELTDEIIDDLNMYITDNKPLTEKWNKWSMVNNMPEFIK